ncbi:XRE family transcriptional regulator, partial [Streptomyces durbertensis]
PPDPTPPTPDTAPTPDAPAGPDTAQPLTATPPTDPTPAERGTPDAGFSMADAAEPAPSPLPRDRRRRRTWLAAALAVATLTALVPVYLTFGRSDPATAGGARTTSPPADSRPADNKPAPISLTTRSHVWESGCDHRYLLRQAPDSVPPPPVEQDAPRWAARQRAVHAGTTNVEVTVQGTGAESVVLKGLYVRVVDRRPPLKWNAYNMGHGCGGSLSPAVFTVDLDADRPQARPRDGLDLSANAGEGKRLPAPRFPFRVSETEPQVLEVTAGTARHDADWYLELAWSSKGRSGTTRIDDAGRPFRTSGATDRPLYTHWSGEGGWTPESAD